MPNRVTLVLAGSLGAVGVAEIDAEDQATEVCVACDVAQNAAGDEVADPVAPLAAPVAAFGVAGEGLAH